jgi:3-oxoacyl-[acyl-carrier protein] reductase
MDLGLEGRVALVTGGSRGIGRATALLFAAEGADVAICARDTEALEATATAIRTHGVRCHAVRCDLADAAAPAAFVEEAARALGRVDILVNNASALADGDDDAAFQASFDVDLMAAVRASAAAVDHLERAGHGAIVHVSSISGMGPGDGDAYSALKAAMISHGRGLAESLGPRGIRVNVVAPGSIDFPGGFWDEVRTASPDVYTTVAAESALRRHGTPAEVAATIVFLASARASLVTGTVVRADGGQLKSDR